MLAQRFSCLDDSVGSVGKPFDVSWKSTGYTFCFPPLQNILLFNVLAKLLATRQQRFLVLLPYWPSKLYFSEFVRVSSWSKVFALRCCSVANPGERLRSK